MMKLIHPIAFLMLVLCLVLTNFRSSYGQVVKDEQALLFVPPSTGQNASANGFQLLVDLEEKVPNNHLAADEPVIVDVSIKNVSKDDLSYTIARIEDNFQVTVLDKAGNKVPLTQYGKQLYSSRPITMSVGVMALAPNQKETYRILVSRQYDMTLYGNYAVTVSWQVPAVKDGKSVKLVSNPIKLSVGDFNWRADDRPNKL